MDPDPCHFPADDERCVHELIEARVRERGESEALVSTEERLSYAQLNARANRVARRLRALGVGPDARVGICLERSVGMIVSILGVLKAGGCYVPLDPAHPTDRLRWILENSGAGVLVTHAGLRERFEGCEPAVLELEADGSGRPIGEARESAAGEDSNVAGTGVKPQHLAYVIYTSGSTGRPKGVMVEHRQAVALVHAYRKTMSIEPDDRFLQFASYGFDASVGEIFSTLSAGATLVLRPASMIAPDEAFVAFLDARRVTVCDLPTAFWQQWAAQIDAGVAGCDPPRGLTRLAIGGEKAERHHVHAWLSKSASRQCRVVNTYGPTETTVQVSAIEYGAGSVLPEREVPIGRPVANTRIYILDEQGEAVPVGVTGELWVGGAQVARGYLNREELTAERFVADRFSEEPGARMYRTGDLGRWLADGTIEYQGRNDGQVKIRGFRIELGEIEARLLSYPGVREAVVAVREEGGTKKLVAYYTRTAGRESIEAMSLREHVQAALPEYMVPAAYVVLERLPLTPNGKVDRRALPEPTAGSYAARAYEAPQGELEEAIARVWSEVLKVEPIGRSDNFFQLGGHSLLVVRVVNQLRERCADLTPMDLLRHQTLSVFAGRVAEIAAARTVDRAIPLREGGRKPPVFLVHDGAGDLLYAPTLAGELDVDAAIYALPSPLDPQELPPDIPAIAARLLRLLRRTQPTGPYRLVGHCFGGVIAYEMTRQLLADGEPVAFLGLLDSVHRSLAPPGLVTQSLDAVDGAGLLRQVEDAFGEHSREFAQMRQLAASGEELREIVDRARELGVLPPRYQNADLAELRRDVALRNAYLKAWLDYWPGEIPAQVHLYVAREEPHRTRDLGWSAAIGADRLNVDRVGGDHYSMLKAPHVSELARKLQRALRAADCTSNVIDPSDAA